MKAIMIMFDTLSRRFLSTYGNPWVHTPNFERLKQKSIQFDNFFCGSLPCMPARRELHTGRYNFLHRSWGPLEPFDVSAIELLKNNGVYTHIVTDHSHYWEDGGATYLPRYNSWEGFRGQEGDRWMDIVNRKRLQIPEQLASAKKGISLFHNWANRQQMEDEKAYPSLQTIEAGISFIKKNYKEDNWFLQIECFDPHEPFMVPERFLAMYEDTYVGKHFDWPAYASVTENEVEKEHLIKQYAALISMCDESLGKILDLMDTYQLWEDTMLIVNTDHGFLMGEHEWWGKNVQPCYNEIAHLPFYMYHPQSKAIGSQQPTLCQTIDIAPTLLDFFNITIPDTVLGKSILPTLEHNQPLHAEILFGSFGHHVNVCDGTHIYMRSPISPDNKPLYEYTLLPTKMRGFFSNQSLKETSLVNNFSFLHNLNVLKVPSDTMVSSYQFGNKLFDFANDKNQENPIEDIEIEKAMIEKLRTLLILNEAPEEQYERLGISKTIPMTTTLLKQQKQERQDRLDIQGYPNLTQSQKAKLCFIKQFLKNNEQMTIAQPWDQLSSSPVDNMDTAIDAIFFRIIDNLKLEPNHRNYLVMLYQDSARID